MKKSFSIVLLFFVLMIKGIFAQDAECVWEKKADFQGGQLESGLAFAIGKNGYVFLGSNGATFNKECWKYDSEKNSWEKMSNFPGEGHSSSVGFAIGNKGYFGTGLVGQVGSKDFWEFDPQTDQWTKKADLPEGIRYGAIGFSIADKGYIALGASQTTFYKDLWEYDPKTNQWTKKADFPEEGRVDASVFVAGKKAYVLLGSQKKNIVPKKKNVWEYDPQTNQWNKKTDFPGSARIASTAFSINNKGYIYAGFNGLNLRYQDVWEYDPATDVWIAKANALCGARSGAFCFVIDNNAFVGTGIKKSIVGSNDLWKFGIAESLKKNDFAIGASLFLGDQRVPMGAVEVQLIDKNNKVIQTTSTNLFGSFLFQSLSKDEDYTIAVKHDAYMGEQKIYLVNRNNKPISTLEKSNDYKYFSSAKDVNTTLLKIDNNNLRMNLNGKMVLNDAKKTPLKNTPVSLISETQEVVQMTTTDENGAFSFTYVPDDSSLYVSVEPKDISSISKESMILLLDDKANIITKTDAAHPSFHFSTLPTEKNTLSKIYVEDPWMEVMFLTKNKCSGAGLSVIENINFESGKYTFVSDAKSVLNKIALSMKENKNIVIEIGAHTDSKGDATSNLKLSEKRANAAKEYLVSKGVDASRIIAKGFGETKLLNKCADDVPCTDEEHAVNRRIEFKIKCK